MLHLLDMSSKSLPPRGVFRLPLKGKHLGHVWHIPENTCSQCQARSYKQKHKSSQTYPECVITENDSLTFSGLVTFTNHSITNARGTQSEQSFFDLLRKAMPNKRKMAFCLTLCHLPVKTSRWTCLQGKPVRIMLLIQFWSANLTRCQGLDNSASNPFKSASLKKIRWTLKPIERVCYRNHIVVLQIHCVIVVLCNNINDQV